MSGKAEYHCDRCGKALNPDDTWLKLEVYESEDGKFRRPPGDPAVDGSGGMIDLCYSCEQDMVVFMSGKLAHDFMTRGKTA